MPVVTLAGLVVIPKHAHAVDHESQPVVERVVRPRQLAREFLHVNLDEYALGEREPVTVYLPCRLHVLNLTSTACLCQDSGVAEPDREY